MTEMITKVLPFDVKEVAPRTLEFIGSTEDKDREGDIIMADGWKLANYKKNPVFMWAHDYSNPPIGKTVKVWAKEGKLRFHVEFADRDTYEFADTIYKLYKGGFLRATSVGFMPIKSEPMEVKEDEMVFHQPMRFLQQDLLELSGCPVPANPNALAEAKAKGLISAFDYEKFIPEGVPAIIEKPLPNEHGCRLRDPKDFQDDSFKRSQREHEGKRYSVIMGKLKGEDTMTDQAFRYPKDTWSEAAAKAHCDDHDGILFEPAGPSEAVKQYNCECVDCGYVMESEEHCRDIKCPKCGGTMRRLERPGPGQSSEGEERPQEKDFSQLTITDDIDFLKSEIEAVGMNEKTEALAWDLVRTIMRESGGDMPVDITEKVGAVLNAANKDRLEKGISLIRQVLDSAEKPEEPEKLVSIDRAKELIGATVTDVIQKAQGKNGGKRT